jgi:hypothetical protein
VKETCCTIFTTSCEPIGGSDGKSSGCNVGDLGLIPGLERSPGEGNGHPLQYSCLENSMDSPWGPKESDMTERLHFHFQLKNHKCKKGYKTSVHITG